MARRAAAVMPGGDTRAITHHEPYSLTLNRASGHHVTDVDGNTYIDLLMNYTSLVHGHSHPRVTEAIQRQASEGIVWPARAEPAVALAELLVERVSSVEQIRFTNSGTEANTTAIHLARIATGRRLILMARFGYYGSAEVTEVGSGGQEGPETLIADFGDADAFERALNERGKEIAAVILEPVMGAGGLISAPPTFFKKVEKAAKDAGALLIVDEVITFRFDQGGAQTKLGIDPDLTTFGKLIGGGLPVGAVGGKRDLLALTDPAKGAFHHSGTFNGNALTCAAGIVAVRELTPARIGSMNVLGGALATEIEAVLRKVA